MSGEYRFPDAGYAEMDLGTGGIFPWPILLDHFMYCLIKQLQLKQKCTCGIGASIFSFTEM